MKTVLVTGGAGFIGSNFVDYLCEKYLDYKIIVLDSLTYAGNIQNLPQTYLSNHKIEFAYGSILNAGFVDKLIEKSDYVVHFAAETHVTRSIFDNTVFYETDVLGTHNIANSVLKYSDRIKRFIHISTSEVYGTAETDKMDEEHPLNPMSPYASAKCGADRLVYSYYQTYKIPCVILRPFNQYGPRQHLEKAVPRFITSCLLSEEIRLHGDGQAGRDWTFVEDTCRGIDLLLHADDKDVVGEVFNLGNDQDTSIKDIALQICELMNADQNKIINISDRPGQVLRHTCCSKKLKDLFGWEPKVSLVAGLKKTIEWYEKNQSFWKNQIWLREIEVKTEDNAVQLH